MENKNIKNAVFIILAVLVVAVLGSIFVALGMNWFNLTIKPSQWIPNFIIPIVWSIIYIVFSVVAIAISNKKEFNLKIIVLSVINGILNILWCLLFFTFKLTFIGNVIILINCLFAYLLWIEIKNIGVKYGYFMIIYPLWVTIATTLNLAIWILN